MNKCCRRGLILAGGLGIAAMSGCVSSNPPDEIVVRNEKMTRSGSPFRYAMPPESPKPYLVLTDLPLGNSAASDATKARITAELLARIAALNVAEGGVVVFKVREVRVADPRPEERREVWVVQVHWKLIAFDLSLSAKASADPGFRINQQVVLYDNGTYPGWTVGLQGTMRRSTDEAWDLYFVWKTDGADLENDSDSDLRIPVAPGRRRIWLKYEGYRQEDQHQKSDLILRHTNSVELEVPLAGATDYVVDGLTDGYNVIFVIRNKSSGIEIARSGRVIATAQPLEISFKPGQ